MFMDEITLVNLLNKICEKNQDLTWKLNCKYHNGMDTSIMQVSLIQTNTHAELSQITFRMENGRILAGKHRGLLAFKKATLLVDALLDILIFEGGKQVLSDN